MNKSKIILLLIILSLPIYSEESNLKEKSIEFGIKIQSLAYLPYEFKPTKNLLDNEYSKLSNNKEIIYPAFFKFRNFKNKFGVDFDMASFRINNATYRVSPLSLFFENNLSSIKRDEFNLNFYYLPIESNPNVFYFGVGLKKIDRLTQIDNNDSATSIYYDKIASYGISLPIRSNINIFNNLFLNLALDPYLTVGKRKFENQAAFNTWNGYNSSPFIAYTDTNPNSITEILGYQLDISLSFLFYDTFKVYFGVTKNQSRFRFIDSQQTNYRLSNNSIYITSDQSLYHRFDNFNSLYFGISVSY